MIEYVTYYQQYLYSLSKSPHTIKQYSLDAKQFVKFIIEQKLNMFDNPKQVIECYRTFLKENYSSLASINRKLSSIKDFLKFLKSRNLLFDIQEELLTPIKQPKELIESLSVQQIKKVVEFWLNQFHKSDTDEYKWIALRNYCLVRIIAELGLKPSEVVTMKWSHFEENYIKIIQRKRGRTLLLSDSMMGVLDSFRKETNRLFSLTTGVDDVWLGVGNKRYHGISAKTIERMFQTISNGLGIKVTATLVRYSTIRSELLSTIDSELLETYQQFGYCRKSVLKERLLRFTNIEREYDGG